MKRLRWVIASTVGMLGHILWSAAFHAIISQALRQAVGLWGRALLTVKEAGSPRFLSGDPLWLSVGVPAETVGVSPDPW
jgi:hypothetical protein